MPCPRPAGRAGGPVSLETRPTCPRRDVLGPWTLSLWDLGVRVRALGAVGRLSACKQSRAWSRGSWGLRGRNPSCRASPGGQETSVTGHGPSRSLLSAGSEEPRPHTRWPRAAARPALPSRAAQGRLHTHVRTRARGCRGRQRGPDREHPGWAPPPAPLSAPWPPGAQAPRGASRAYRDTHVCLTRTSPLVPRLVPVVQMLGGLDTGWRPGHRPRESGCDRECAQGFSGPGLGCGAECDGPEYAVGAGRGPDPAWGRREALGGGLAAARPSEHGARWGWQGRGRGEGSAGYTGPFALCPWVAGSHGGLWGRGRCHPPSVSGCGFQAPKKVVVTHVGESEGRPGVGGEQGPPGPAPFSGGGVPSSFHWAVVRDVYERWSFRRD